MACSKHVYVIKRIPEWEYLVECKNCETTPDHTICGDDEHVFVQAFGTVTNPSYGYTACSKCGHTGGEIMSLGGKVNPNSNIWGIRNN